MTKLVRPAFRFRAVSANLKREIYAYIIVPNYILPMDVYNALLPVMKERTDSNYGWIDDRGIYYTPEECVKVLHENKAPAVTNPVTIEHYKGEWKYEPEN